MLTAELDYYLSKTKKALADSVPPPLPSVSHVASSEDIQRAKVPSNDVPSDGVASDPTDTEDHARVDTSVVETRDPPPTHLSPLAVIEPPIVVPTLPEKIYISGLAAKARAGAALGTFDHTAAVYASLGFVGGMLAWHAVGFWGFVSNVVFRETTAAPVAVAAAPTPKPPALNRPVGTSAITTGSITPLNPAAITPGTSSRSNCVALIRNPEAGAPTVAPCARDIEMRDAGRTRRSDRLQNTVSRMQDIGSWARGTGLATVAAEPIAAAPAPVQEAAPQASTTTLTQDDVNLDMSGFDAKTIEAN